MRIFVTGASGWIGSAVVPELVAAGHDVLGLARSDSSAQAVTGLGAQVHRGSLDDLGSLRDGAAAVDGVVHLAYHHDFSQMAEAAESDRRAIETFGEVLAGTDRPLLIASGVLGLASGDGELPTEQTRPDPSMHPRVGNAQAALDLADRGVRSCVVRLAPTVHGEGDQGFVAVLTDLARRTGFAGYVDDGVNRWAAVNRADAATLIRLAVESAPAGSVVHAVGEQGIATVDIATSIGRSIDVPVRSVPAEEVPRHFGWIGAFFATDCAVSNDLTRDLLHWTPTHPGLLADLAAGYYADVVPHSSSGG